MVVVESMDWGFVVGDAEFRPQGEWLFVHAEGLAESFQFCRVRATRRGEGRAHEIFVLTASLAMGKGENFAMVRGALASVSANAAVVRIVEDSVGYAEVEAVTPVPADLVAAVVAVAVGADLALQRRDGGVQAADFTLQT